MQFCLLLYSKYWWHRNNRQTFSQQNMLFETALLRAAQLPIKDTLLAWCKVTFSFSKLSLKSLWCSHSRDMSWLYPVWMRDIFWKHERDTIMSNFTLDLDQISSLNIITETFKVIIASTETGIPYLFPFPQIKPTSTISSI